MVRSPVLDTQTVAQRRRRRSASGRRRSPAARAPQNEQSPSAPTPPSRPRAWTVRVPDWVNGIAARRTVRRPGGTRSIRWAPLRSLSTRPYRAAVGTLPQVAVTVEPKRRLADPWIALERERGAALARELEETRNGRELALAAHHPTHAVSVSDPVPTDKPAFSRQRRRPAPDQSPLRTTLRPSSTRR